MSPTAPSASAPPSASLPLPPAPRAARSKLRPRTRGLVNRIVHKSVAKRIESGLRSQISIERQWPLRKTVFTRAIALQPRVAVRQAPGQHSLHGPVPQHIFQVNAVEIADDPIAFLDIRGQSGVVHIQF